MSVAQKMFVCLVFVAATVFVQAVPVPVPSTVQARPENDHFVAAQVVQTYGEPAVAAVEVMDPSSAVVRPARSASPIFGLLAGGFSDYGDESRKFSHHHHHHKPHYKPEYYKPEYQHHGGGGSAGSYAAAGSFAGGHGGGISQSQAQSQSASFGIGPIQASFSSSSAQSGSQSGRRDRERDYFDY